MENSRKSARAGNVRLVSRFRAGTSEPHYGSRTSSSHSDLAIRLLLAAGAALSRRSKTRVIFIGLLCMGILGELDFLSGPEISFSIFYLIPIGFVTWRVGKFAGIMFSMASTTIWMAISRS